MFFDGGLRLTLDHASLVAKTCVHRSSVPATVAGEDKQLLTYQAEQKGIFVHFWINVVPKFQLVLEKCDWSSLNRPERASFCPSRIDGLSICGEKMFRVMNEDAGSQEVSREFGAI